MSSGSLRTAVAVARAAVASLDAASLTGEDAATVHDLLAETEEALAAARVKVARHVEGSAA